MADSKISDLGAASALVGTELVPIVQSGVTVKSTAQDIAQMVVAPLYTVELIDVLTIDFYTTLALSIDSVTDILNAPTTTILVGGSAYVLGSAISIGSKVTVTVSTAAVVQLVTTL